MRFIYFILSLFAVTASRPIAKPNPKANPKAKAKGIGQVGVDLIKDYEKLRLVAYMPTPNDVWTIGYGHTSTTKPGMKITEGGADTLLRHDLDWVEDTLADLVKVPLNRNQYDALASLIFNIGRPQFTTSTVLKRVNAKDFKGASEAFLWWDKQKGKVLNGLVKRRERERLLFLTPT